MPMPFLKNSNVKQWYLRYYGEKNMVKDKNVCHFWSKATE